MNPASTGFALSLGVAVLAAMGALLAPERARPIVAGVTTAASGASGLVAGVAAMMGHEFDVTLPDLLPMFGIELQLDPLGGVFIAVIGGVAVAAAIYGIGYAQHGPRGRTLHATVPLFVAAMLLVPVAGNVGTFLFCWELMAFTSLLLVIAEHGRRAEAADAGLWYAVMTHLGLVAILIGLALFAAHAGGGGFDTLRSAAPAMSPALQAVVFVATLVGFGSKAGAVPLHAWLPRAHPEAPSHVSALMSAAMVNLGIYGLVRVGFDLLGGGLRWWWLTVLVVGALSAVHGILQAAMSDDLKRLLGYSTTENMGLVLIGVGAAGLFTSSGYHVLGDLALAAALLHVINHAAFKTLLFLSAGSVLHAAGTRSLDDLGGLRARMPATTALFGLGALAASALPPGTAFVSEWLLLQGLVHGLTVGGVVTAIAIPIAVSAVALTAGVAVATFVKAFGVGFLARARTSAVETATESPRTMIAGMGVAGVASAALAIGPTLVVPALSDALAASSASLSGPVADGTVTLRLEGVTGSLSPLLLTCGLVGGMVAVALLLRFLAARRAGGQERRDVRLWDCGSGPMSARMEYTATSFAEPLQRVFDDVIEPEYDVDVTHYEESRYLVESVRYRRLVPDRMERRLYQPVLATIRAWGQAARPLATGSIHRYLGYGFYTVIGVLVLLAVTR